jgi:16S rRNA (adenine1518-N6/adenine1519-N6)-dimethyltransferase
MSAMVAERVFFTFGSFLVKRPSLKKLRYLSIIVNARLTIPECHFVNGKMTGRGQESFMKPKKYFGQHFLTSVSYARRIADSIPADPGEHVLEIGPGRGALSIHLKSRFPDFHCVEIDPDVIPLLSEKLGEGHWTIHNDDALEFDFAIAGFPLHIVGNLPYSIGAMIIRKSLLYGASIRSCTFMVQREVAQRIVADPHSRRNGFLSIFCQFFGRPTILFHIPRGAFFPRPNVDSSVFQLILDREPEERLPEAQWRAFFAFVDKGFRMRRKMLVNVLGRDCDKGHWTRLLEEINVDTTSRPEDLDTGQWLDLYKKSCGL